MNSDNFNVKFGEVINTGGGTSDFNQLTNRPKYDGATMTGDTNIPKVPTTTSELTNNSGFITGAELGAETAAREQADNTLQGEIDGLNNSKADKSTTYTKTEVDTALGAKADKSTTYTKTEVDTALGEKADKNNTYTKAEADELVDAAIGQVKVLTTDDYNWPVDNPTGIAPWLLDEGWYTGEDGVRLFLSQTGSSYITLYKGKTFYIGVGTGPGGEQYYRTKYIYRIGEHGLAIDGGAYRSVYAWITWFANDGSGTQTMHFPSLADLSERVVQKAGAPTTGSEGVLGQLWEDSSNGELYQLKSIDTSVTPNTYTWEQVGGGGGPTVVQTTGTSTTDVMSQNAVTSMVFADPDTQYKIKIGAGTSSSEGNNAIEIGHSASASGLSSVACGYNSGADAPNGVAIGVSASAGSTNGATAIGANARVSGIGGIAISGGWQSSYADGTASIRIGGGSNAVSGQGAISLGFFTPLNSDAGKIEIGSTNTSYGYNSSNYRLLTGLYDGQSAHDAATYGQVISYSAINGAGAPTTATEGRYVGQLYYDTTNESMYFLKTIDTTTTPATYTWEALGGGGSITPVQVPGDSTTDVMSQNAVTSMVFADPATQYKVKVGYDSSASGNNAVTIGRSSWANAPRAVAVGYNAHAIGDSSVALGAGALVEGYYGAVALGAYSKPTRNGEINAGTTNATMGFNNSNYRLLTGLYDPQSAHDAATKGYVDPTTDSSAPTAATAGRLGEIRIDTTTNTAYMCVLSDSTTPVYEWKQITA